MARGEERIKEKVRIQENKMLTVAIKIRHLLLFRVMKILYFAYKENRQRGIIKKRKASSGMIELPQSIFTFSLKLIFFRLGMLSLINNFFFV